MVFQHISQDIQPNCWRCYDKCHIEMDQMFSLAFPDAKDRWVLFVPSTFSPSSPCHVSGLQFDFICQTNQIPCWLSCGKWTRHIPHKHMNTWTHEHVAEMHKIHSCKCSCRVSCVLFASKWCFGSCFMQNMLVCYISLSTLILLYVACDSYMQWLESVI